MFFKVSSDLFIKPSMRLPALRAPAGLPEGEGGLYALQQHYLPVAEEFHYGKPAKPQDVAVLPVAAVVEIVQEDGGYVYGDAPEDGDGYQEQQELGVEHPEKVEDRYRDIAEQLQYGPDHLHANGKGGREKADALGFLARRDDARASL